VKESSSTAIIVVIVIVLIVLIALIGMYQKCERLRDLPLKVA
jgi:hypothetical protein